MENQQGYLYYKGYVAGYRDGAADAANGVVREMNEQDIASLPVEMAELSARARNCLSRAGCMRISDVISLSDHTIATMRNLGGKTASEIARWLDTHGICYSAWNKYL